METVAYKYPDRTRSVHSIASSTGRSQDDEKQGVYGPNRRCHQSAQPLNPKKKVVGVLPILVAYGRPVRFHDSTHRCHHHLRSNFPCQSQKTQFILGHVSQVF